METFELTKKRYQITPMDCVNLCSMERFELFLPSLRGLNDAIHFQNCLIKFLNTYVHI